MKHPDSTSYYNQIELENDLKKYLGLPPYDTFTNPVAYDGSHMTGIILTLYILNMEKRMSQRR